MAKYIFSLEHLIQMTSIHTKKPIILASASETRKLMLEKTKINFSIQASSVDEDSIKQSCPSFSAEELGLELASQKALNISQLNPDTYVIGADQVCEFNGEFLDKPGSIANCVMHLNKLSGKTHTQNCSIALAYNNTIIWSHQAQAILTMRNLTDSEIKAYVALEQPLHSCGSYMFERHGKHLFSSVIGNDDVILGMPLVELLSKLYELGVIELNSSS
jgi:septum formation protein